MKKNLRRFEMAEEKDEKPAPKRKPRKTTRRTPTNPAPAPIKGSGGNGGGNHRSHSWTLGVIAAGLLGLAALVAAILFGVAALNGEFKSSDSDNNASANANANANASADGKSSSDTSGIGGTTNGGCHVINDYGLDGKPEVATSGSHLRVQFWNDGTPGEKETFLPSSAADGGRFNLTKPLKGHVWEFDGCTDQQMRTDADASTQRRVAGHADNVGYVDWCTTGLFQPSQANTAPTTCSSSTQPNTSANTGTTYIAPPVAQPQSGASSYLAPAAPAAPSCPDGIRGTDFNPVPGQEWNPAPTDTYRVVNLWSNWPNHSQNTTKFLLSPGEVPKFQGGGSFWYWPSNCQTAAQAAYDSNPNPAGR